LHCDIYFMTGQTNEKVNPFHIGCDERTSYGHVSAMASKEQAALQLAQDKLVNHYKPYGHSTKRLYYDREITITATENHVNRLKCQLIQAPAGEHEKICERYIRTLNSIMRSISASVPFKIPAKLNTHLLKHTVQLTNIVPNTKTGAMSPKMMVQHEKCDARQLTLKFGDWGIFKTTVGTVKGIVVGIDENSRNTCHIWSPDTDQYYHPSIKNFEKTPIDIGAIQRINDIATNKGFTKGDFFVTEEGAPLPELLSDEEAEKQDDDDNEIYSHDLIPESSLPDIEGAVETIDTVMSETAMPEMTSAAPTATRSTAEAVEIAIEVTASSATLPTAAASAAIEVSIFPPQTAETSAPKSNRISADKAISAQETTQTPRVRTQTKSFVNATVRVKETVLNIALKKMLQTDRGTASATKEIKQFLDLQVFKPRLHSSLTKDEKANTINIHMFGKEKRTHDELKTRGVGLGNHQHKELYQQTDTSSPTVKTDTIMLQLGIAAYENRYVSTMDIPGAYLHAEAGTAAGLPVVIVRINPAIGEIMLSLQPDLKQYLHIDGCLYMECMKALYGLIESAYLWYKTFCAQLYKLGYTRSDYDLCFFYNKTCGTQISLHVDDTLITAKHPSHTQRLTNHMTKQYGGATVHSLEKEGSLDFLAMRITKPKEGGLRIDQQQFIEKSMKKFNITTFAKSPADDNLFDIDDSSPPSSDKARFVSALMTCMYASLRSRPDTVLAVTWLTTRAQNPTKQDDKKLLRLMSYLNKTAILGKRLKPSSLQIFSMADASFNVHPDMKGHTGTIISLGSESGVIASRSAKQKIQGRSSTESELYALHDVLSGTQWARNILEELGYKQDATTIFQDNKSTICLGEKGHSNDGKAKHIKAKYFYAKHLIDGGVIKLKYLPTNEMTADILTKPLNGIKFITFRRLLLGEDPVEDN